MPKVVQITQKTTINRKKYVPSDKEIKVSDALAKKLIEAGHAKQMPTSDKKKKEN